MPGPQKIGRYEIVRLLGRGAMGNVYLARDPQIERELALKTIRFDASEKGMNADEAKARFLKEARIAGRLQHPHIVTVFDVGEDEGTLFLAMEFVPGGSFSQKLGEPGSLSAVDRIRVVAEVAEALAHAHERGVLHRDVKPANILLTPSLSAKVTDFGIGKLLTGDTDLTSTGQMVGSPAYMSPEQIKGEKLDARSDIFSLGVVLYQALTQRKPFPADTLTTLVYQILHEEPPDPLIVQKDLPPEVSGIVRKCLAKSRSDRYSDAAELAADLRAAIGFTPVSSTAGLSESKVHRTGASPTLAQPTIPSVPAPPPPADPDSPTITTGRRMGAIAKKVKAEAAAGRAPGPTPKRTAVVAASIVGLTIVAAALLVFRRSPPVESKAAAPTAIPVLAPPAPTVAAASPTVPPAPPAPATGAQAPEALRVVEKAPATPLPAPTRAPRPRPTAAPTAAPSPPAPAKRAAPAAKPADLTLATRRLVKVNVSPLQARVFLDGIYIGISDDWDGAGGGALLSFVQEGTHRLRLTYPGKRDLNVDVVVKPNAEEEKVEIEKDMVSGTPDGPTGPEGHFHRPDYRTVRGAIFDVVPPDAHVVVNGRDVGPASNFATNELQFADQAVYDVVLSAPGYEPKTLRVIVGPTTGEIRARIREKLKKAK